MLKFFLLRSKSIIFLVILFVHLLSIYPISARQQSIALVEREPNLVLVKGAESSHKIVFRASDKLISFKFPILGSRTLLGWYFQPAGETQKYHFVESEEASSNASIGVYQTKITSSELLLWTPLLNKFTKTLEKISKSGASERPAHIQQLLELSTRLPSHFKIELQTDLLISRLLFNSDLARQSLLVSVGAESCLLELSTFSEYCFELLRTRSNALERVGDFKAARNLKISIIEALSGLEETDNQRSRIIIMSASAEQLNVHIAVAESDLEKVQSSIDNLKEVLKKEEAQNLLSTSQKGLVNLMIGSALTKAGDFESSIAPLKRAEQQFKESENYTYLTSVYSLLHTSNYVQGRYLSALDMITLALDLVEEDSPFYHYYLLVQGSALAKLGRYQQAKASLITAKNFYESSQNPYYLSGCNRALAVVERELGNYDAAKKLHESAIDFFLGKDHKNPRNLYSYLAAKSESLITSLHRGDILDSRESAAELERLYLKYADSKKSPKSLPQKAVLHSLASYASVSNDQSDLVRYRDKLNWLLNDTQEDSYLLEKAQLEQLNMIEDLQQGDFIAAASHFQSLMSQINKTRDQVRVLSFQRGYSNLVKGFAEPLIEKLSLSLDDDWDSDTANILLEVLNQIQGSAVVEASRSARARIANGIHYNIAEPSSKSLNKEIEVFKAQNQKEKYALRAKADHSVLRENVIEAKIRNSTPEKFVHQLASIDVLVRGLSKDEIYLNSFDANKHSFILYLSKSRSGIISIDKSKSTDRLIETTKQLLVDRYSEPEPILDQISNVFSLEEMLGSGEYQYAITTGDGLFSEIPFSTLRVNGNYLGSQISNTHIASTSYYFSSKEVFDAEQAQILTNDIGVIADPNFDIGNLISLNQESQDENYQSWISSLNRLPWSAKESRSIEAAFPSAKIAVRAREQATINALKNLASTSNILHIATHGYFSSKTPELAGIALTKTLDSTSGFLSLNQISKLDIASRLVVFSACETARSEESEGDSGWGLAQAVLYAGARNAVGTLWKVPDRQTALFFESFYNSLSDGQRNISTSLFISKRAMINSKYSHPFYWAGFKAFATKRIDTYPFEF